MHLNLVVLPALQDIKIKMNKFTNQYQYFNNIPCSVKLNSWGNSRPFGNILLPSRNSLKNGWAQACKGVILAPGVYSSNRETKAIASGGVRALNT